MKHPALNGPDSIHPMRPCRVIIQPLLSLLVILIFLFGALASLPPDNATNTTVPISDCKPKPSIGGSQHVTVHYSIQGGGVPIGVTGFLFFTRQLVTDTSTCAYSTYTIAEDVVIGDSGFFETSGIEYGSSNSGDLFRIELNLSGLALYTECRQVQVVKYPFPPAVFNCVVKRINDL